MSSENKSKTKLKIMRKSGVIETMEQNHFELFKRADQKTKDIVTGFVNNAFASIDMHIPQLVY